MKNKEALEFYKDNGLDEIISEKPQNHFLALDKKIAEVKTKNQNNVTVVKPVLSTSQALSTLAKKSQQGIENSAQIVAGSANAEQKFIPLNEIVAKAKKAAQAAGTIEELRKAVENSMVAA